MAHERSLAGMFPDVPGQVLAPGEAQCTWREVGAEETLRLLFLIRHIS